MSTNVQSGLVQELPIAEADFRGGQVAFRKHLIAFGDVHINEVMMTVDAWQELGSPQTITVRVEPFFFSADD